MPKLLTWVGLAALALAWVFLVAAVVHIFGAMMGWWLFEDIA